MSYKYQVQLSAVSATLTLVLCPCQGAGTRNCVAYRLAQMPGADPKNFLPRPLEGAPPPRKILLPIPADASKEEVIDIENDKCDLWGISLFDNPTAARRLHKKYRKFMPHTHIAELRITPSDGDCTPSDENNHFNLHEFAHACLSNNVIQIFPI